MNCTGRVLKKHMTAAQLDVAEAHYAELYDAAARVWRDEGDRAWELPEAVYAEARRLGIAVPPSLAFEVRADVIATVAHRRDFHWAAEV